VLIGIPHVPPNTADCRTNCASYLFSYQMDNVFWAGRGSRTPYQLAYLCNLPADTTPKMVAAAIKARRVCEQAHQQMKEELGLDHFEGRPWQVVADRCCRVHLTLSGEMAPFASDRRGGARWMIGSSSVVTSFRR